MATYRYWRLSVTANNGASWLTIGELHLRNSGVDLNAIGKTYDASNNASSAYLAFDGNVTLDNFWYDSWTGAERWVQVDMGSPVTVDTYGITRTSGDQFESPKDFTLQGSDDGSTWDVLDTQTAQTAWTSFERRDFTLAAPETPHYVGPFGQDVELIADTFSGSGSITGQPVESSLGGSVWAAGLDTMSAAGGWLTASSPTNAWTFSTDFVSSTVVAEATMTFRQVGGAGTQLFGLDMAGVGDIDWNTYQGISYRISLSSGSALASIETWNDTTWADYTDTPSVGSLAHLASGIGSPVTVKFVLKEATAQIIVEGVLLLELALTNTFTIPLSYLEPKGNSSELSDVSLSYFQPGPVTKFGTPYAVNAFRAESIGRVAKFGTPSTPTFVQAQANGWRAVRFGTPYLLRPFLFGSENFVVQAQGWRAAHVGDPTVLVNFIGQALGWNAVSLGAPKLTNVMQAESLGSVVQFGDTATLTTRHSANGWDAAQLGTPVAAIGYLAQGWRAARFGTPIVRVPGSLIAYGWQAVRFGTPRVFDQLGAHPAEGFSAVHFGVPSAVNVHRAQTIGRVAHFGRPTLRRNPTC